MERATPLPALSELAPLVGTWRLVLWGGSFLPDPEQRVDAGLVRFEWSEGGSILAMHQGGDDDSCRDLYLYHRRRGAGDAR